MKYKKYIVKNISKFNILSYGNSNEEIDRVIDISQYFWNTILNLEFFQKFVEEKYIPYKEKKEDKESFDSFIKEYYFLVQKLPCLEKRITFRQKGFVPEISDIFFSYRIFDRIISYYNEYYSSSDIHISLSSGISFGNGFLSVSDFFERLENAYLKNNNFISEIVFPILDLALDKKIMVQKGVFKFEIFWPEELILSMITSTFIQKSKKKTYTVVDFSQANEQFDFSQWVSLIKESGASFFSYIDFFIIDRDFGRAIDDIILYANKKKDIISINNILYKDNEAILFQEMKQDEGNKDMIESFLQHNFDSNKCHNTLGGVSYYGRFLPYKCYWNNCNFCAINLQNKFIYDKEYSYDFFIDRWIKFIEENKIESIIFQDEALPPGLVLKFAKEVIKKRIKINYRFRTRFEKLYTFNNCKILFLSGARYCGMGLESAVERVNKEIGNKGNDFISLKEKLRIIYNFDNNGISIHNYSIIGFPGETDEEIIITYKFLKSNIQKSSYFTCTPNIFALMKGPNIFKNREKLGVEVLQKDIDNPFNLVFDFTYKGKQRNISLLNTLVQDIHKSQFLPWIDDLKHSNIDTTDFWSYIDRGSMFYLLKCYYKKSPYLGYRDINKNILKEKNEYLLAQRYRKSDYIQVFEHLDFICIYDWVLCGEIILAKEYKDFIFGYNSSQSLQSNLIRYNIPFSGSIFRRLLEKRIFIILT